MRWPRDSPTHRIQECILLLDAHKHTCVLKSVKKKNVPVLDTVGTCVPSRLAYAVDGVCSFKLGHRLEDPYHDLSPFCWRLRAACDLAEGLPSSQQLEGAASGCQE